MAHLSKGQYYIVRAALGATEKEIINFYELEWHLKHRVPTVEQIKQHIDNWHLKAGRKTKGQPSTVSYTALNYYLNRAPVKKALEDRGIPYLQHTQETLTPTQVAAAVTVMNFADTRPIDLKLDQLGVNPSQYYAWLNDPAFKNMVDSLSEQNLTNVKPTAITEFTKLINKGDWQAIKYYLDVTGTVKSNDAPQSEVLIRMLIEIIQKHVKDPATILAIAEDIKLATANRTLETAVQPAIESYSSDGNFTDSDISVEDARRQLGV